MSTCLQILRVTLSLWLKIYISVQDVIQDAHHLNQGTRHPTNRIENDHLVEIQQQVIHINIYIWNMEIVPMTTGNNTIGFDYISNLRLIKLFIDIS